MAVIVVTHPEVVVDPTAPIESWTLSAEGRERAGRIAAVLPGPVGAIVSSTERKATDTAAILASGLGRPWSTDPALGEMNRSSTGYLPPAEFEATVDAFFETPQESARGWERAIDAQRRFERAIRSHLVSDVDGDTVFVTHGGVAALLLAALRGEPISRAHDQPGLGSFFTVDPREWAAIDGWRRIE